MQTFTYDDIFEINNGKYYDYKNHKCDEKEKLNTHILDTIEIMLKDIPDKKIEFQDIWLKHLRDRNNKKIKYLTTLQLGAQNILDILGQLVETMCHEQRTRRISVKQIRNWNIIMDDLDNLMSEYYEDWKGAWSSQKIEMQQAVKMSRQSILESLIAK